MRHHPRVAVLLLALSLTTSLAATSARAGEHDVPFDETFVLERAKALGQLLPQSPDWFYYRALDAQLRGDLPAARAILDQWEAKRNHDQRLNTLRVRQVFLAYDDNPAQARQEITNRLGLFFNHQPPGAPAADPALPSKLDALDPEAALRDLLANSESLREVADGRLPMLAGRDLNKNQRHAVLERLGQLGRGDFPGLVDWIAADMAGDHPNFGGRGCDAQLTLAQLGQLAEKRPQMLADAAWAEAVAKRLPQPEGFDPAADIAALEGLATHARRLAPALLDHKAAVLLNLLAAKERTGVADRALLLEYLAIPRHSGIIPLEWRRNLEKQNARRANLSANCFGLRPAGQFEGELVERLLRRLLRDGAADPEGDAALAEFRPLLERGWLLRQYAVAKMTAGQSEVPALANILGPEGVRALRDEVVVDLAPDNPRDLPRDLKRDLDGAAPSFKLALKHVTQLRVRVWKLDLAAYYRGHPGDGAEVDPLLDLDGVIPTLEKNFTYPEQPFLRHDETIALPELAAPGTWVVDFIGEGRSARAVVHQGRLQAFSRPGAAGHRVFVLDAKGAPVAGAAIAMGEHRLVTDADGGATIPYTRADREVGPTALIVSAGELATRITLQRQKEQPSFGAAFELPRELLRGGAMAPLCVTPRLAMNGEPADLALLKDWRLECAFTLQDGTPVQRRIENLKPGADGRLLAAVEVPAGAATLSVQVFARLPGAKPEEDKWLSQAGNVTLGQNAYIAQWFQRRDGERTVLELRGANGEPIARQACDVRLEGGVWNSRTTISQSLATDASGRVDLGVLPADVRVAVSAPQASLAFAPSAPSTAMPPVIQWAAGAPALLPWTGNVDLWTPRLTRIRNGVPVEDLGAKLGASAAGLQLPALEPGDYLLLAGGHRVQLRVEPAAAGALVGRERLLEPTVLPPVAGLTGHAIEGDQLVLRFSGALAGAPAGLTVLAHRLADDDLSDDTENGGAWAGARPRLANTYLNGRVLDGEFRYILDRQLAKLAAGNMLERPGLLLHPWDTRETQTEKQTPDTGMAPPAPAAEPKPGGGWGLGGNLRGRRDRFREFPQVPLDFLASPAQLATDLKPDAKGELRLSLKDLGDRNLITVRAGDGPCGWQRTIALPLKDLARRDARLATTLPLDQRLAEIRTLAQAPADGAAPAGGLARAGARLETRGDLYRLLGTLNPGLGADWAEFAPLARWETLAEAEKETFYARHACHELRWFVFQRDPAFFNRVVKPTLANKKDPTLLDEVLLGKDLSRWLEPRELARLNAFELAALARATRDGGLARHEQDEASQLLVDPAYLDHLFRIATRSGERGGGGGGGGGGGDDEARSWAGKADFAEEGKALEALSTLRRSIAADAAPPAPAAPESARAFRQGDSTKSMAVRRKEAGERQKQLEGKDFYRDPGAAKEWAEHNWWHTLRAAENPAMIARSRFWADYAAADPAKPFFSPHLLLAHTNLHEALLALAVVDLPALKPADAKAGGGLVVTSTLGADPAPEKQVFVQQRFFSQNDRQEVIQGQPRLKVHRGPFRPGVVYGCELVVSNPAETARSLSLLRQIPAGAMPVGGGALDATSMALPAYGSGRLEYFFYFPAEGDFKHYPAQAAEQGQVVGGADPATFHVSRTDPAPLDNAFAELAAKGTQAEVLAFLKEKNLAGLDLSLLAHRLRDKQAYAAIVGALRTRRCFDPVLWSYGVLHGDAQAMAEFLPTTPLAEQVGPWFDAPLLGVDATRLGRYQHMEYSPFINARLLPLNGERGIPHEALRTQYGRLLEVLRHKKALAADDRLALAYYLALQDRVAEAQAQFDLAPAEKVDAKMQRDYFRCWLLFSAEKPQEAKAVAAAWKDCPLPDWNKRFAEVVAQADAIAAGAVLGAAADPAAKAAALEARMAGDKLELRLANLAEAQVALYPLDLEVQFSRQPFALQAAGAAPPVKPAEVLAVKPGADGRALVDLPAAYARRPLLLEVTGGGLRRLVPHQPHAFDLVLLEAQGQLQVTVGGKPCPRAYVKVYAKAADGTVSFHKDGTTDLRGRFDYTSVNTGLSGLKSFAILVVAPDDGGACVREVGVPRE